MRHVGSPYCVWAVWTILLASPLAAQERSPPDSPAAPTAEDPAESEIAFRFSKEFFSTLLRRQVNRTTPVNQNVLGAWVTGTAHTRAEVDVLFQPNPEAAQVYILLTGQTVSNTVGAKGPARVYSTTVTRFRAWKLVRFDTEQFVTTPAGIEAQTWSYTRCIASTAQCRLVNRIVRRVAAQRVADQRGYTTSLANWQARQRVLEGFNEAVDRAIQEANLRLAIRQTLLARFGGLENLKYSLSTTSRYLEVYVNIASDADPRRPPIVDDRRLSPLEIWVHTHIEDEVLPPILRDWTPRYRFFIERAAERLAERITPEEVDFQLEFTPQLDWVVMRFGDELMERIQRRVQERREREGR